MLREDTYFYVIYLISDGLMDLEIGKNIVSSLMLFLYDYEHALTILNCSLIFSKEEILISDNRDEIIFIEKVLKEFGVNVLIEKHAK